MKSALHLSGLLLAALLAACGGGDKDEAGGPPPTVTASSASAARYSETMLITLTGANLEPTITVSSAGCRNMTRSTAAPFASTAVLAYYTCTVSGVGAQTVTVTGGGLTAATIPFTVAQPEVTMAISNGGGGVAGTLVITLRPQEAPATVDNFLAYVKSGFYNNTVFHRHGRARASSTDSTLVPFVLQGGGYAASVSAGTLFPTPKATNAPIALEAGRGLSNVRYSLAMARTNVPNSATSQFFINTANNSAQLDASSTSAGYAVFGSVTGNTALVDAMVAAPCTLSPLNFDDPANFFVSVDCVPTPNLIISSATQTK